MEPSLDEILEFGLTLSHAAGEFILPLWDNTAVEFKADGTVVTEADRVAEHLMRGLIANRYPDHAILGEEHGGEWTRDAEHLGSWIQLMALLHLHSGCPSSGLSSGTYGAASPSSESLVLTLWVKQSTRQRAVVAGRGVAASKRSACGVPM